MKRTRDTIGEVIPNGNSTLMGCIRLHQGINSKNFEENGTRKTKYLTLMLTSMKSNSLTSRTNTGRVVACQTSNDSSNNITNNTPSKTQERTMRATKTIGWTGRPSSLKYT